MKLVVLRHGQSEANLHTYYTGQMDVMLTEKGKEQARNARRIMDTFKFDKVYCSDLVRTAETCALAIPNMEAEHTPILREYDVGSLMGIDYADIVRIQTDDVTRHPDYTAYGGEDAEIVRGRARRFLQMLENSDYECVAAVSHYGFMNCLLQVVLGTYYDSLAIKTRNCSIFVFDYNGDRWRVLALNYMTPIADTESMKDLPAGIMPL